HGLAVGRPLRGEDEPHHRGRRRRPRDAAAPSRRPRRRPGGPLRAPPPTRRRRRHLTTVGLPRNLAGLLGWEPTRAANNRRAPSPTAALPRRRRPRTGGRPGLPAFLRWPARPVPGVRKRNTLRPGVASGHFP